MNYFIKAQPCQDKEIEDKVSKAAGTDYPGIEKELIKTIKHLKSVLRDNPETVIADARYGFTASQ